MPLEYILVGIVIGFLSGIFGIGGSMICTPVLRLFFGIPELIALASPLPVTIPTAISGTYSYWQKGLINKEIAVYSIMYGLPATILGAWATKYINCKYLMILTGILVITTGLRFLNDKKIEIHPHIKKFPIKIQAGLIGLIAGVLSGLLAVGGGFILVPAFVLILGLSMQEAAATSLLCVAFYAIPGTVVHSVLHHIDWHLVLNLSIGVIPASYLGARVGIMVKSKRLQTIFAVLLITFGIYFVFKQAKTFVCF